MAATVSDDVKSDVSLNNNVSAKNDNSLDAPTQPPSTKRIQEMIETYGGYSLDELFNLATTFLKEKEGKAFQISYKDKLMFVAYYQQISHGPFNEEKSPPLGYLDVIGRDRRQAWQSLGNMSQNDAKVNFIDLLHNVCPLFRPFVLAHKCDLEEKARRKKEKEEFEKRLKEEEEEQRIEEEKAKIENEMRLKQEKEKENQNCQKRLIQEALNRQTFRQFKAYAEKQYPGDPDQQGVLIRQLQEQHYQQYMQQVLQEQLITPEISKKREPSPQKREFTNNLNNSNSMSEVEPQPEVSQESSNEVSEEEICDPLPVAAANMWTRKDISDFKESIRKEGGDGIIKVGHGETVTVRVPTHDDGTCLFWEFATDNFDLGFGVYFEWTRNPDAQVTVHISESEDEEEEDELEQIRQDIERGVSLAERPPISVIIPVYRRDCHEEVYAGSHSYPGQGVYLFKFDNSYSLWRSKTLYYRVYYTR